MRQARPRHQAKTIRSGTQARALLERWRRDLANLSVELKRPREIDVVPVDLLRGEPAEREGPAKRKFRARLIYFTRADFTIRRPSGAILVIDKLRDCRALRRQDALRTLVAQQRRQAATGRLNRGPQPARQECPVP